MGDRSSIVCFPAFRVRCCIDSGVQVASFCISKVCCPVPRQGSTSDRFYFKVASAASDFLVKEIDRSSIDAVDVWRRAVCSIWGLFVLIHKQTGLPSLIFQWWSLFMILCETVYSWCSLRSSKVNELNPNYLCFSTASFHSPMLIYPATGTLSIPS